MLFHLKVFDQSALSHEAKEEMYKLYPSARRAHLKTGGNFPYLCRSAEVNLYIQVSVMCSLLPLESASVCLLSLPRFYPWSFNQSLFCVFAHLIIQGRPWLFSLFNVRFIYTYSLQPFKSLQSLHFDCPLPMCAS